MRFSSVEFLIKAILLSSFNFLGSLLQNCFLSRYTLIQNVRCYRGSLSTSAKIKYLHF